MFKNNRSRGFTLIELLVVIAIIGVLSAVVLASLSTARSKGQDAAVQSDLATVQTQAEIFYGRANGNDYGTPQAWVAAGGCAATAGTMFADTNIAAALSAADAANGGGLIGCASTATTYVVAAALVSSTAYHCVDSTGVAKTVTAAFPAAAIAACP